MCNNKHTPNRHCRKIPASLKVKLKRKYSIKIDGQILVIYPSKFYIKGCLSQVYIFFADSFFYAKSSYGLRSKGVLLQDK